MTFRLRFIVFVLLTGLVWPSGVFAQGVTSDAEYRALLLQLIAALEQQIGALQMELARREQGGETVAVVRSESLFLPSSAEVVATYAVRGGAGVDAIPVAAHREYAERVFALFPERYDQQLAQLMFFRDDSERFDAFVETLPPRHRTWSYGVNIVVLDETGTEAGDELIYHELAHLISYDTPNGIPSLAEDDCHPYFASEGCLSPDMYLSDFVATFWDDDDLDRALGFRSNPDPVESAYRYYQRNEIDYVSDYAALAPEEDFAESFAVFVTDPIELDGTRRSSKVQWFGDFPEFTAIQAAYRASVLR
jgi:hypothetical protein